MKIVREHFLKLLVVAFFALSAWAGRSIISNDSAIGKNKLHIDYMKDDIAEIKEGVRKLLKRP